MFLVAVLLLESVCSWNDGSVLLRDIQVLTLYKGRYTTGRRSSPVPQLQCVGGSAGCHKFVPDVVQCQNKGWDGVDVQWECKTDMDNSYRFGRVEVSCEGFSHPADPYVLTGSCGLEYTLELTEEGRSRGQGSWGGSQRGFGDFASSFFSGFSKPQQPQGSSWGGSYGSGGGNSDSGGLLGVVVLLLIAYGIYKVFLSGNSERGPNPPDAGRHGDQSGPPPPGFKPDYTSSSTGYPGGNPGYGFRSDFTQDQYPHSGGRYSHNRAAGGGGFWSGMGTGGLTGGLLGYLFGQQRGRTHQPYGHHYNHNDSFYRPPPSSSHSSSSSSGTRTASGFGGTKRR